MKTNHFNLIHFDGWFLGPKKGDDNEPHDFSECNLEFDCPWEAVDVREHWNNWINGMDV